VPHAAKSKKALGATMTPKNNINRQPLSGWFMINMVLAAAYLVSFMAVAQEEEPPVPQPITEEIAAGLELRRERVIEQRKQITALEERIGKTEDRFQSILETRLDMAWIRLLEERVAFAEYAADQEDAGYDIAVYRAVAISLLESQSDVAGTAWQRVRARAVLPAEDASAADQAAEYSRLFDVQRTTDRIFDMFMASLQLSRRFGIDTSEDEAALKEVLTDRATNVSVFLEISLQDVIGLHAGVEALPEDAELKAKASIAEGRVQETAKALERIVAMMSQMELDTTEYKQQLLTATGAITTDIFDFTVIRNLLSRWGQSVIDVIVADGPTFFFRLIIFLLIIYVFRKLAKLVEKLVNRGLSSSKIHLSQLLNRMIISVVSNLVLILGVLVALSQVGISLGPLLAGLGIAGFVIGFALQDTLSNFASGLMILFYRPFDVGDTVEAGGVFGKVNHMSLVNTTFLTFDNQTIILPNNLVWGGVIKNVTAQKHRRVDLTFGVSYTDDIPKVERVLQEIIAAHDKILDDPEPTIKLHELAESSVNFIVRPWVESDDYWDVYWDLMRTVKARFDEEGISIPFPQRDVHLYNEDAT
jgi:small conductance mechanosensitive channel